jgi:hypothetical protein
MNHWQDHFHLTNENHIKRRIHMQDQVGANKIEELMHHYDHYSAMDMWTMKFVVVGAFLMLGVYGNW